MNRIFVLVAMILAALVGCKEDVVLCSIAVTTPPSKNVYLVGEAFDPAGMVVTAMFSDNSQKPVTVTAEMLDYDFSTAGAQSITITYTENGKTATTTVNGITVNVKPIKCDVCDEFNCKAVHVFCELCDKWDCDVAHVQCPTCNEWDCVVEHVFCELCDEYDCGKTHARCTVCKEWDCVVEHVFCVVCDDYDCVCDGNGAIYLLSEFKSTHNRWHAADYYHITKYEHDEQNRITKVSGYNNGELMAFVTITYIEDYSVKFLYDMVPIGEEAVIEYLINGNTITYDGVGTFDLDNYGFPIIEGFKFQNGNFVWEGTAEGEFILLYDTNKSPFYYSNMPNWLLFFAFDYNRTHSGRNNLVEKTYNCFKHSTSDSIVFSYEYNSVGLPTKRTWSTYAQVVVEEFKYIIK